MKKIILGLGLLIMGTFGVKAQGFEGLIVEKFYVTNAADNAGSGGPSPTGTNLPTGSVVWRFYADLATGYQLQSVFGDPAHQLTISTTTSFFNNLDRGSDRANAIGGGFINNNTNYIDTYITMGGTCSNRLGVLKTEDDAVNNLAPTGGTYLQNADVSAGQPLTVRDGQSGTTSTPASITIAGFADPIAVFDNPPSGGASLVSDPINGGAWATAGNAQGPTANNRVLIAQITSDGVLTYAFSLQIRNTTTGVVEQYVPTAPGAGQQANATLAGVVNQPNALPTVNITAPSGGATYLVGQTVTINATASDIAPGTVSLVEFLVDNVVVGSSAVAPYTFDWTSTVGSHNLTARATDNLGGQTTSSAVNIIVGTVIPPTISITAPLAGAVYTEGDDVTILANAADVAPGFVTQVEFFVNGTSIGIDNTGTSPFTIVWPSTQGNATITAVATDNDNATSTPASVSISVFDSSSAYTFISSTNPCSNNTFCLPLNAIVPVDDVIGYDMVVQFDNTEVQPTGVVTVSDDLVDFPGGALITTTANSIDLAGGKMYISVFFNGSAPANAEFTGTGELLCVQFARLPGFASEDTADISLLNGTLQESYFNGVQPKVTSPGQYITFQDGTFESSLKFWFDNSPIKYDAGNTSAYLITDIKGSDGTCAVLSATAVQPDLSGNFTYDFTNGTHINIDKNIPLTTSVQPVVNGFDAFLTRRLLVNDATFIPSIYQMVAMDVNTDGVVSAGDISQINLRAVLQIGEYRQDWNYSSGGAPLFGPNTSKDWLFIDGNSLNADPAYQISTTFPFDDGVGYSRFRLPQIDFCLEVPIQTSASCNVFEVETYTGVLLGDVNGNYATVANNGPYRLTNDKVVFDLSKAVIANGVIEVPVEILSAGNVNSLDFSLQFNQSKLSFQSVLTYDENMDAVAHLNTDDQSVRFTSYNLNNYDLNKTNAAVRFAVNGGLVDVADLSSVEAYLNGEKVTAEVKGNRLSDDNGVLMSLFPNPSSSVFNIVVSEDASYELMDLSGKIVAAKTALSAMQNYEISTQNLSNGVYMLKVFNNNSVSVKKVVVKK